MPAKIYTLRPATDRFPEPPQFLTTDQPLRWLLSHPRVLFVSFRVVKGVSPIADGMVECRVDLDDSHGFIERALTPEEAAYAAYRYLEGQQI